MGNFFSASKALGGLSPIGLGLGAIQGLAGLGGLLGAAADKRRAEAARQAAIADMARYTDQRYNQSVQNDRFNLLGATGLGGDAINALGRNLGSNLAGAGIYNSSAAAGALQQATAGTQASLAGLAGQNYASEQGLLNQNRQYITGLKSNLANSQYGEAVGNLNGARSGLSSLLGSIGQFNLGQSGATLGQNALGRDAGGYGSLGSAALQGAGAGVGASNFNPAAFGGVGSGLAGLGRSASSPLDLMHGSYLKRQAPQFGVGGYNPNGY